MTKGESQSTVSASVASLKDGARYVGYVASGGDDSRVYICNSENFEKPEEIFEKIIALVKKTTFMNYDKVSSCDIVVDSCILAIDCYRAQLNASGEIDVEAYHIDDDDEFFISLNDSIIQVDNSKEYIVGKSELKSGINKCIYFAKNRRTDRKMIIAQYNLIPKESKYAMMEVRRNIPGNVNRKDLYRSNAPIASNMEYPLYKDSVLHFSVKDIRTNDTVRVSDSGTRWFVNDEATERYTGAEFRYVVQGQSDIIKAKMNRGDSVQVTLNPIVPYVDGRVRLDYSAVAASPADTVNSRKYFNVAVAKCDTLKVGEFMKVAPKEIVMKTRGRPLVCPLVFFASLRFVQN